MTMSAEAAQTEVERLKMKRETGSESIWHMKKEELVEVARRELGQTRAQAEKETVLTLRELVRRKRKDNQFQENPLNSLPKGLGAMKKEELMDEALKRNLPTENQTRAGLILLIRDDVESRAVLNENAQSSTSSAAMGATPMETAYRPGASVPTQAVQDADGNWIIIPIQTVPQEVRMPAQKRGYRRS